MRAAIGLHVDGRHLVRPGGVAGGPLQHLHPDRRVGAGVPDGPHPDRLQHAVGVAPGPVLETHRVPLGVHPEALLTRQRALHRAVEQPRRQRCLGLVAHVLLAPEGAAVGDELDDDLVGPDPEHPTDVVAVVPHALATGVDVHRLLVAVPGRDGQRRFRLQEGVLDALGLEHLVDGVGTGRQQAVDVAAGVHAARQDVVVGAPHGQLGAGLDRRQGIGHRCEHVVADLDQLRRRPRLLARLGDDDGQHVAGVRRATADGDHDRPVLVDDPDAQLARDVRRREDPDDTGGGGRGRRVDRRDVGAGVRGEVQRGVEHAGHADVVDVPAVAERQLGRLVLGARRTDRTAQRGLERLALGHGLDGVEDLDVAGAPTQVGAEVRGHRPAVEVGALLVDLRLGPHDDAGDAEPALQPTAGGERIGEALPLVGVDALERHDLLAGDLLQPEVAADDGLAVDHHRAAAALARRRAAVLGRRDVELLAQRGQQVGVVTPHGHRRAVERELGRVARQLGHRWNIPSCDGCGAAIALHSVKRTFQPREERIRRAGWPLAGP